MIPIIPTSHYLHELSASMSDEEIAEAVGLSRTSIWRLRTGRVKRTHTEHGIAIANLHAQVVRSYAGNPVPL